MFRQCAGKGRGEQREVLCFRLIVQLFDWLFDCFDCSIGCFDWSDVSAGCHTPAVQQSGAVSLGRRAAPLLRQQPDGRRQRPNISRGRAELQDQHAVGGAAVRGGHGTECHKRTAVVQTTGSEAEGGNEGQGIPRFSENRGLHSTGGSPGGQSCDAGEGRYDLIPVVRPTVHSVEQG